MNKFLVLLMSFGLFAFSGQVNAQDSFEQGRLQLKVIEAEGANAAQIKGMSVDVYKSEDRTKTVINMMSGMVVMTIIEDKTFGLQEMYVDAMGNKMKSSKMIEEEEEEEEEKKAETDKEAKYTYKYFKDETKKILAYDCYKVEATDKAGQVTTLYVTEDLKIEGDETSMLSGDFEGLDGSALEIQTTTPQGKMVMQATVFEKEASEADLASPTGEYKEVTPEEMGQMMGGM